MRSKAIGAGLASLILLGACASQDYGNKELGGGLLGGAAGAVAGAQFGKGKGRLAGTAAGALLGALVGGSVGKSLDRADRLYATRAEYSALEYQPSGYRTQWANPDNGNHGVVTPMATYQAPGGLYCREYQHTIYVGGNPQQGYGRACRQPDGTWQTAN